MVTPPGRLGRAERAAVWVLCRLLPVGFRARQRSEWTGDLIAIGGGAAIARWRYLFAAAWTLPALRAQVYRSGLDSPRPGGSAVRASVAVEMITKVLYVGLGLPVLSWFIAIPFRYVLLDIPGRFAHMQENPRPFDPMDLWPVDGPFVVLIPLWVALSLGAWAALIGPLMSTFVAFVATLVNPKYMGASRFQRVVWAVLGAALLMIITVLTFLSDLVPVLRYAIDRGLSAGLYGCLTVLAAVALRGLSRRRRMALVLVGLGGIAVFVTHQTAVGEAMLSWYLD